MNERRRERTKQQQQQRKAIARSNSGLVEMQKGWCYSLAMIAAIVAAAKATTILIVPCAVLLAPFSM